MAEFLLVAAFVSAATVALAWRGWVQVEGKAEDPVLYQPKAIPEADRFTRLLRQSI